MKNKKTLSKEERKKIIFISDSIQCNSGIAIIARSIILGTSQYYNWVNIGGLINNQDKGKRLDMSEAVNKELGIDDASLIQYPTDGYGNPDMLRQIIDIEKPEAIVFITDPRQYQWLFNMEHEIRTQGIKLIYVNIWDETGIIPFWNYNGYAACDGLLAISKQTADINERVIKTIDPKANPYIKYFPHGTDHTKFFPIEGVNDGVNKVKKELFGDKEYEFVVFFNSRNIRRKSIPDLIMSFKLFLDTLSQDDADRCALVLHTQPIDDNGTDLPYVVETVLGERRNQVIFDNNMCPVDRLNILYNIADVTCLISSNEGFGISGIESIMAGTPIIVNVTGGMQDYCRFIDDSGEWFTPSEEVPSNHLATYPNCGIWAFPIFPSNLSIQGSTQTPAIIDSRCSFFDVADRLKEVYKLTHSERKERGLYGRQWLLSDEAKMSVESMCNSFIEYTDEIIYNTPDREQYNIVKVEDRPLKYTPNIFAF